MIQASPMSMNPNMTGLNQTALGTGSPECASGEETDFVRGERAMQGILALITMGGLCAKGRRPAPAPSTQRSHRTIEA